MTHKGISLYLILWILATMLVSCNEGNNTIPGDVVYIPNTADGEYDMNDLPVFEFGETTHDFGVVIRGEIVSYGFKFINKGKADLLIANISTNCGCAATKYPKEPIKPGEENYIQVTFDSSGRKGFQNKTITIAANTQPTTTTLSIKAMVIIPERN